MKPERIDELITVYRDGLLGDTIPFWVRHGVDRECGGFLTCLDRDGTVIDTDKAIWLQGRFAWLLSTLYSTVERRSEWLELARHGLDFLDKVMIRLTLAGAFFLIFISLLPQVVSSVLGVSYASATFLGGTSILIVVAVALDLVDRINAQLLMRNYEGFMKGTPR